METPAGGAEEIHPAQTQQQQEAEVAPAAHPTVAAAEPQNSLLQPFANSMVGTLSLCLSLIGKIF